MATSAATVAGKLNSVRPVLPRITTQHHVEGVEGDAGGDQADRFVGVEELRRGEGADDPAREQPHAGDDEGAAGDEPGDDRGVGAARLVVVADRVGERRPGELEAADEDVDRLGELDRERVEAGLGEADGADDDDPVDEVEQRRARARPASSAGRSASAAAAAAGRSRARGGGGGRQIRPRTKAAPLA